MEAQQEKSQPIYAICAWCHEAVASAADAFVDSKSGKVWHRTATRDCTKLESDALHGHKLPFTFSADKMHLEDRPTIPTSVVTQVSQEAEVATEKFHTNDAIRTKGGIKSTNLGIRYDAIPGALLRACGRRFYYGIEVRNYPKDNWRGANQEGAYERLNHLIGHIFSFLDSPNQDDLDAVACNTAMLCEYFEKGLFTK